MNVDMCKCYFHEVVVVGALGYSFTTFFIQGFS
jgi:hypothetical protein